MPLGAFRAKRYRYTAPRSITTKSAALQWGERVRREIEGGKPAPQSREGRALAIEQEEAARKEQEETRPRSIREAVEPGEICKLADQDLLHVPPLLGRQEALAGLHLEAPASARASTSRPTPRHSSPLRRTQPLPRRRQ